MTQFAPYADGDIDALHVQPLQADALCERQWFDVALAGGPVWTIRADDGRVLWIGGFLIAAENHASAWCLLAENVGAAMVAITRICRALVDGAQWQRLDMAIRRDIPVSVRWAGQLGFVYERPLDAVPDHDVYIYRRAG